MVLIFSIFSEKVYKNMITVTLFPVNDVCRSCLFSGVEIPFSIC